MIRNLELSYHTLHFLGKEEELETELMIKIPYSTGVGELPDW